MAILGMGDRGIWYVMELIQRQRLVQEQRLSPEQVQYYELLQKPILELEAAIEEELRENPALEVEEMRRCPSCGEILEGGEGCNTCSPGIAEIIDRPDVISQGTLDYLDDLYSRPDGDYEASFYESPEADEDSKDKFARAIRTYTLSDYLDSEFPYLEAGLSDSEKLLAMDLIHMVDGNGFIPIDDEMLAAEVGSDAGTINKIRLAISAIKPVGATLRNPTECLLRQLEILEETENAELSIERELVEHYLEDAVKEQFAKISKKLGVKAKRVSEAFDFIRTHLHFSPATKLDAEGLLERGENIFIEPDVRIFIKDGHAQVELIEVGLPSLKISSFYQQAHNRMKNGGAPDISREDKKHIREHLYKANKFIEHINTRRETIMRVVGWLVEFQEDYILRGPAYLKPLTRERLANEIGYHPSTVTRALISRYVQFPDNSVRPFSVFFDGSLSVIAEMKKILEEETSTHVLSDEEITDKLLTSGHKLSRRAITKYRHLAKIPSSGMRKRALKEQGKQAAQTEAQQESV